MGELVADEGELLLLSDEFEPFRCGFGTPIGTTLAPTTPLPPPPPLLPFMVRPMALNTLLRGVTTDEEAPDEDEEVEADDAVETGDC